MDKKTVTRIQEDLLRCQRIIANILVDLTKEEKPIPPPPVTLPYSEPVLFGGVPFTANKE